MKFRWLALFAVCVAAIAGAATAGAARRDVAQIVGPSLVDINTNLGYENGAAAGTGIVLTSDGIVLTNNHVIRGATKITATSIGNGRTYTAKVLGYSVTNDVAVIKLLNASGLTPATIGDSTALRVGQTVTAIGNAGGVGGAPSASAGTITGLNKAITASDDQGSSERLTGLIETDAALEPGDSGGALVDENGAVIGMNTAGGTTFNFQQSASDGYAITTAKALAVEKLILAGKGSTTVHIGATPMLGVSIQQASGFELAPTIAGAPVRSVVHGLPAARVGITAGSVITSLAGKKISTSEELSSVLLRRTPNTTVAIAWTDAYGTAHRATVKLAFGPPQ